MKEATGDRTPQVVKPRADEKHCKQKNQWSRPALAKAHTCSSDDGCDRANGRDQGMRMPTSYQTPHAIAA